VSPVILVWLAAKEMAGRANPSDPPKGQRSHNRDGNSIALSGANTGNPKRSAKQFLRGARRQGKTDLVTPLALASCFGFWSGASFGTDRL